MSESDAWDLASSIGAEYIETSSRNNVNIDPKKEQKIILLNSILIIVFQLGVKDAFDTAIWDALRALEKKRQKKSSFWKKLICLA